MIDKYHSEVLRVFRENHGMTKAEVDKIKANVLTYETFAEREEYLKGIIYLQGQKNKENREFREWC